MKSGTEQPELELRTFTFKSKDVGHLAIAFQQITGWQSSLGQALETWRDEIRPVSLYQEESILKRLPRYLIYLNNFFVFKISGLCMVNPWGRTLKMSLNNETQSASLSTWNVGKGYRSRILGADFVHQQGRMLYENSYFIDRTIRFKEKCPDFFELSVRILIRSAFNNTVLNGGSLWWRTSERRITWVLS